MYAISNELKLIHVATLDHYTADVTLYFFSISFDENTSLVF